MRSVLRSSAVSCGSEAGVLQFVGWIVVCNRSVPRPVDAASNTQGLGSSQDRTAGCRGEDSFTTPHRTIKIARQQTPMYVELS